MGVIIPQVITNRSGAQIIDGSLKFNHSIEEHLAKTPGSDGNRRTFTVSTWVKMGGEDRTQVVLFAGPDGDDTYPIVWHADSDSFQVSHYQGGFTYRLVPNAVHRDTGWYHVVTAFDTTQSTSSNRIKLYVNGEQITSFSTETYPTQNYDNSINESGVIHKIGFQHTGNAFELNGSLSQFYFIDGQQLGPEYFGYTDPLTNTWKPKKYNRTGGINDGRTWSSDMSGTSNSGVYTGMFDGTFTGYEQATNGNTLTYTPTGGLTANSSIRIYLYQSSGTYASSADVTVNGSSIKTGAINSTLGTGTAGGWVDIGTTSLTTLTWSNPAGSNNDYRIFAIDVDGVMLIDGLNDPQVWGKNGFYLPFDGNSPIGQDKSGRGNDWTPVNFGGSVALDNPQVSGLRPILNVTQGGSQAGVGVFGSKQNVGYAVTVYDDGGGNKYYIDGVKQATLTGLIRGATYTFDTSDSTVGSTHPFRFAASDGGSQYSNGVAAITGTATTITIPYNAPNELYYYCTSHSGMGSSITGITTNEKLADQYASHCTLALSLVGANSDVSASIACTTTNKSVTSNGTAAASSDQSNFYNGSFEFDGDSDYLSLADNTDFELGSGDFTLEAYVYQSNAAGSAGNSHNIINKWNNSGTTKSYALRISDSSGQKLQFFWSTDGTANNSITSTDLISVNRWHHVAVVNDGGTITLYINGKSQSSTGTAGTLYNSSVGFKIGRTDADSGSQYFDGYIQDVRVYKGAAKYTSDFVVPSTSPDILPDTPSGVSGSSKLAKITDGAVHFDGVSDYLLLESNSDLAFGTGDFTIEFFVYMITDQYTIFFDMRPNPAATQGLYPTIYLNSGTSLRYFTNSADRITGPDLHARRWYHIAVSRSGSSTRMFLNGVQQGSTYSDSNNYLNGNTTIGCRADASTGDLHGFMSNVRVLKGTALYTSRFTPPTAPLTDVTNTKLLCCQSPTSATTAAVAPGSITANGDASATNFNPFNTDINTVRGQETGYPTLNPLSKGSRVTLSNNNLDLASSASTGNAATMEAYATFTATSGKFYAEVTNSSNRTVSVSSGTYSGPSANIYSGGANNSLGGTASGSGASFTTSDILAVAIDFDKKNVYFYKNNTLIYSVTGYTTELDLFFADRVNSSSSSGTSRWNFGQKPFKFPPPDGFQPLNTANTRPVNVISRPDQYVGVTTYKGNNTVGRIIDIGRNADLVWVKKRSTAENNILVDTVRGENNFLMSDADNTANTSGGPITGIGATVYNGFIVDNNGYVNANNADYVCWNWKAGGDKNTFNVDDVGYASAAAAGLTGGDITPTGASVGTKQGFSIIKYDGSGTAGDDFPHGLLQTPEFIIVKDMDDTDNWQIYHAGAQTSGAKLLKFTTDEATSNNGPWNNTAPTSTLITLGGGGTNDSGNTHICYAWHSVPGLQKFGSYEGNNSTDGTFVELGFRPALLIVKNVDAGSSLWLIADKERNKFNPIDSYLHAESNADEYGPLNGDSAYTWVDFLSNGFKLRQTGVSLNAANTYIYAAWAEAPTVDLYGGGANAR